VKTWIFTYDHKTFNNMQGFCLQKSWTVLWETIFKRRSRHLHKALPLFNHTRSCHQ
jgi:hypothetical protein